MAMDLCLPAKNAFDTAREHTITATRRMRVAIISESLSKLSAVEKMSDDALEILATY